MIEKLELKVISTGTNAIKKIQVTARNNIEGIKNIVFSNLNIQRTYRDTKEELVTTFEVNQNGEYEIKYITPKGIQKAKKIVVEGISYGKKANDISIGVDHTILLNEEGELWTWGSNIKGQLGTGDTISSFYPIKVETENKFKEIIASFYFSIAIDTSGNLWGWGSNDFGQLGIGNDFQNQLLPIPIKQGTKFKKIACGTTHVLAIDEMDNLWAWGNGGNGAIGNGTKTSPAKPVQVKAGTKFIDIAVEDESSFAIDISGNLWGSGTNNYGELGIGNVERQWYFTHIGTGFSKVAAGYNHTIALEFNIKEIAAGNSITFLITQNGELYGFGNGSGNSNLFIEFSLGRGMEPTRIEVK